MKYSVSPEKLSIDDYRDFLSRITLIPSRKALQQNIEAVFSVIKSAGVNNLSELIKALSSPQKLKSFSLKTGLSEDYLVLLKREAGCLEPKPLLLKDFLLDDVKTSEYLLSSGIKSTKEYYELFDSSANTCGTARLDSLPNNKVDELLCLCALSRINGIGAVSAKWFLDAGYRSVSDVAGADAEDMLKNMSNANEGCRYYKGKLTLKDIQFCIDYASILLKISD